jgi:CBS domain-containing protein
MRVKTLMRTRFATVTDDTPLEEARSVLAREQVETIPVVREGVLVGLLRARDIERLGPSTVTSLAAYDWAWGRAPATVRAALTADLATLTPEASVHDAIRVLAGPPPERPRSRRAGCSPAGPCAGPPACPAASFTPSSWPSSGPPRRLRRRWSARPADLVRMAAYRRGIEPA